MALSLKKNKRSKKGPKIVCLGGGVGTVNLLKGLKKYSEQITVVCSMADDGGSGGRLRRLFSIPPPGDLINCLSALSGAPKDLRKLLTFRFKGDRWGRDDSIGGQKLGNLVLVALTSLYGNFSKALEEAENLFSCHGEILPATRENVSIWARTVNGKKVVGEETIDLGKYDGATRGLSEVHLTPKKVTTPERVKKAIGNADLIIAGPGDLYTTILPVLLVSGIKKAIKKAKTKKVFVINIANKPFETPNYQVIDYVKAIKNHCQDFLFEYLLINNNFLPKMPKSLNYCYVHFDKKMLKSLKLKIKVGNFVDENFPLYHNSLKTARALINLICDSKND